MNLEVSRSAFIGNYTSIGEDGFYWRRDDKGVLHTKPHKFGVKIEDHVWIGSHVSVDRGRWRDTVIGEGTKIDDHCHIAHNVIIGKHCLIGPGVILLGSCEIGDYSEIWSGAIIHQGVKIGKNCTVGANSYIRHDLYDDRVVYGTGKSIDGYDKKEEGGGVYRYT